MKTINSSIEADRILWVTLHVRYGIETFHASCPISRMFAQLLGQKTLTRGNIEIIKRLGFEVKMKEIKL